MSAGETLVDRPSELTAAMKNTLAIQGRAIRFGRTQVRNEVVKALRDAGMYDAIHVVIKAVPVPAL